MAFVLLILGIVVAASGVAAIGFGFSIPFNEFTLGATLISGGTTALTGGFILIGLSAVVSELARLTDGLKRGAARPTQRSDEAFDAVPPTVSAGPAAAPAPRISAPGVPVAPRPRLEVPARDVRSSAAAQPPSPSSVEVSAAAIERLRSTIPRTEVPRVEPQISGSRESSPQTSGSGEETPLSPNGAAGGSQPPGRARVEPAAPEPRVVTEERPGGSVDSVKASRLDFLFRSKSSRPAPQPESFDAAWPPEPRAARAPAAEAPSTAQHIERRPAGSAPVQESQAQPAAPEVSEATILKSGVVDGMAYTLYTDGSIEAKLPQGTIRFGSVAELRAHIESNS
jgi:hypothetical protein